MTIYIVWGAFYMFDYDIFCGAYAKKEDSQKKLRELQDMVSVDKIEYRVQEYKLS